MTDAIEVVSDPITVVPGTAEYAVDAGSGMEIVRVLRAWIGRTPLIAVTPENTLAPPNTYSGSPTHFRVSAGSEESNDDVDVALQLLPTPDAVNQDLVVRASVRPTLTARRLPSQLVREWDDALIFGAAARLRMLPGTAFTDMAAASTSRAVFLAAVSDARRRHRAGFLRAETRVRGPRFA